MRATVLFVAALVVLGAGAPLAAAAPATQPAAGPAASDTLDALAVQENETTDNETADNETTDNETADNETENETLPGAQLAGVVGVQGAAVTGEVEQRTFGLQVAAARSNASKASVVANQSEQLQNRLTKLRAQKQALLDAKANGTIPRGKYRAKMATLSAKISTLQRLTNATTEVARGLPAEALAAKGVNVTKLQMLKTAASNLSGPQVAAIARNISGPPVNITTGPPGNVTTGPPGNKTTGPNDNRTTGPPGNKTTGPKDNTTTGPPGNKTTGRSDTTTEQNETTTGQNDNTTGRDDNTTTGPPTDNTTTPRGRTTGLDDNSTPARGFEASATRTHYRYT